MIPLGERTRCRTCHHKATEHRRIVLQGSFRCRALLADGRKCDCVKFEPVQIHLVPKENKP